MTLYAEPLMAMQMHVCKVARPMEHYFRSAHFVDFHHLKPGSRENVDWVQPGHWSAYLSKSPLYMPFPVTFLMTAPGSASQLSAFLGYDSRTKPQYRALAGGKVPLVAAVHTLCFTNHNVSPLALRAQPCKLTAYATKEMGDIMDDSLALCLVRLQAVVNGDTWTMRTLSDDAATPS